jgi:hypothetical protein
MKTTTIKQKHNMAWLEPGYFEPTPEWNRERTNDRL